MMKDHACCDLSAKYLRYDGVSWIMDVVWKRDCGCAVGSCAIVEYCPWCGCRLPVLDEDGRLKLNLVDGPY